MIDNILPDDYGLNKRGDSRALQLRTGRPEVARHAARMVIRHAMDYDAAASAMLKARKEDATEAEVVALGRKLETDKNIQRELRGVLEELGYGDDALKTYLGLLWSAAVDKANDRRWPSAMKLLGDILGADKKKDGNKKVPSLRIEGADELMKNMLGDDAPTNANDVEIPDLDPNLFDDPDDGMIETEE